MSDALKLAAGQAAVNDVKDGMVLGIGTGSTAEAFIACLAKAVSGGLSIVGVPTSVRTHTLCEQLGIPTATLEEHPVLDLTIDGADEIDRNLDLIKGAGGALLREKIVASSSKNMLVIADQSKKVETLGAFDLPIEVVPFGLEATRRSILATARDLEMTCGLSLRKQANDETYLTDGGHFIFDASFGRIPDPQALSTALNRIPGVVENGLFIGLATKAIVAGPDGIEILERARPG